MKILRVVIPLVCVIWLAAAAVRTYQGMDDAAWFKAGTATSYVLVYGGFIMAVLVTLWASLALVRRFKRPS